MSVDEFWALIDLLKAKRGVDTFSEVLAGRSGAEISSFWDHLVGLAAVLNTQEYRDQGPVDVGDEPDDPIPLGDDAFLDARIAVVCSGRETYEAVRADARLFSAAWPFNLGEDVVEAVGDAYERSTGDPWPHLNPDVAAATGLPRMTRHTWFTANAFHLEDNGNLSKTYEAQLRHLEHLLNSDRRWWDWWDTARGEPSLLALEVQVGPVKSRRSTLRTGTDEERYPEVVIALRVPEAEFQAPAATTPAPQARYAGLARDHVEVMFAKLKDKFDLDPPLDLERDAELLERQRQEWEAAERRRVDDEQAARETWNRHRSSEHVWRGRAPDKAINQLIVATR